MRDRIAAVVLFVLTFLFFVVHFPRHQKGKWETERRVKINSGALNHIRLPLSNGRHGSESITPINRDIFYAPPPSETQVAQQITQLRMIRNFNLNGWFVRFLPVAIGTHSGKKEIIFRAIAEQKGMKRYSYRVSESETNLPENFLITVEGPIEFAICDDGTEPKNLPCYDGSNPR